MTAKEVESLELNVRPQEFAFSVNGKPATFKAESGERWVFDNNKGRLDQWTQATVKIDIPTIDKTKHNGIGIYGSTSSAGLFLTRDSFMLFGGRKWDGATEVGAGVQVRF